MKNAADYGFRVSNNGLENARALQRAVLGGGEIRITEPGIYEIADQILLENDTHLCFCKDVYLKRADHPNENGYVFINRGAYTKTYDKNISITGLRLVCNGVEASPKTEKSKKVILGLLLLLCEKSCDTGF